MATKIDVTGTTNNMLNDFEKEGKMDFFDLTLDLQDKMNQEESIIVKGFFWSIMQHLHKHRENVTQDQLQRYRTAFELPTDRDTPPTEEKPVAAESVKTKDTSLYLESFRF